MSHQGCVEDVASDSRRTTNDSGYVSMVHDQKSGLPKLGLPKPRLPKLRLPKLGQPKLGFPKLGLLKLRSRSIGWGLTTFFGDEFEHQKLENLVDSDNPIPRVATRPNESVKSSIQVGYVKVHTPNVSYKE